MTERKPETEGDTDSFIIDKTVPASPARIVTGPYRGYVYTLLAKSDNTGNVYIGKSDLAGDCTYPLVGGARQVTKIDLDKLFWYSDNGTEVVHIWAEKEE